MTKRRPEHTDYRDEGCSLHPTCLTCPLPACRYDLPYGWERTLVQQAILLALAARGLTDEAICAEMGITKRTLRRLWQGLRKQQEG